MFMSDIDYKPTIEILNPHATIVSSAFKTTTPPFHKLWGAFIVAETGLAYLQQSSTSPVSAGYWNFLASLDNEVVNRSSTS
jgi:hypothetical protein